MTAATSFEPGLGSIIGMRAVRDRLTAGVVAPLVAAQAGELMARPPAGVLLHGAPGCGVRTVARALVAELGPFGARGVGDAALMEAAEPMPWGRGLVVGWTHRPWDVPSEAFGIGGFELSVYVPPPDWEARRFRAWEVVARHAGDESVVDELVARTEGWSGRDLAELTATTAAASWLEVAAVREPSTAAWMRQAHAALAHGDIGPGFEDLRCYLERYRLV